MSKDLSRLFSPKSIAIIGGGVWGENVIRHCTNLGFTGTIYPVHPQEKPLFGYASYPSIEALSEVPDAAYICVNRKLTIEAVAKLSARGAGGAVCLASGFKEATAEDSESANLQDELLAAAGDMPLIGPNCYGFINFLDGMSLWPDQHGGVMREGGVAVLAQSSNIAMNLTMQQRALPLSHVFAVGNQAQLDMAEIAMALLDDPRVTALGLHIEGVKSVPHFEALAEKASRLGKPIIALKVGKSETAQTATISHTASLAGSFEAARAFFDRLGIQLTESLPAFCEALKLAHIHGWLTSNKIASLSCSGGEASLIADEAESYPLEFPKLSSVQFDSLRAALGPLVALANPLDYHTYIWRNLEKLTETFTAMARGNQALTLVILDFPRIDRCDATDWQTVVTAVTNTVAVTGARFGMVATLSENMPEALAEDLLEAGIVPFAGIEECLAAISGNAARTMPAPTPLFMTEIVEDVSTYSEYEAKAHLEAAGITAPKSCRVEDISELEAAARALTFPLVLKGEGFAHKTESGAVVLGLQTVEALMTAAEKMNAKSYLLEEMIAPPVAELILGVTYDPSFGYMMTIGAGGVMTEILKDNASVLLPSDEARFYDAIQSLKIYPVLEGYRGKAGGDMNALVKTCLALQDFVINANGNIREIEINPLMLGTDFAIAADALLSGGKL